MSRIKMSFSLILAIFLVGILSTAAFAKDPYGLKPVSQRNLSLLVPFTGNSADATDVEDRSFDVVLIAPDGTTVVNTYQGKLNASLKGSVTVPAGDLTPGSVYTVKLYHTDDATHATLLSKSSAVVLDPSNADMYKAETDPNGNPKNSTHVDVTGNGLQNDNLTGFNNTRKNRSGQKVHGFYQNNTNSCASCHQTHTAANGESLLFKDGVYSTCSACHDGTTGAYNSFAPVSEENAHSIAGTFNVQTDPATHNGSLHQADGSLKISAAPGGNKTGGQYDQEFDCASCHAAHGSGSAGENNLNTDPMGWATVAYGTDSNDAKNGKLFKNIPIYDPASIPTEKGTPYILVKTTTDADQANVDKNYFYKRAGVTAGQPIIQTYRWSYNSSTHVNGYVPDYSLWLQEKGYPYKANTILYKSAYNGSTAPASGQDITRNPDVNVVWRDGFAWGAGVANVVSAQVAVGIDVETTANMRTLYDSAAVNLTADDNGNTIKDSNGNQTTVSYIPDSGDEFSKYCTACHVDYLSGTRTNDTGVYTTAHRHATDQDRLTCVRCHFGHGSEAQIMKDANDNTYYDLTAAGKVFNGKTNDALTYFKDPNPSSALKRYTGMSVCYACHGKGEQFMGNPNTNQPDKTTNEYLKNGDPGSVRASMTTNN